MREGRKHRSEEGCLCVSLLCVGHERVCVQLQQEGLHAQQCSPYKDACSLAGAVGIKAEVTLAQRAKVAVAKPSERSFSGEKMV